MASPRSRERTGKPGARTSRMQGDSHGCRTGNRRAQRVGGTRTVIISMAFLPHPPMLLPGAASGAVGDLAGLLAACDAVVDDALAGANDVLLVGTHSGPPAVRDWPAAALGSARRYGAPVRPGAPEGPGGFPLSLAVGSFLLGRAGTSAPIRKISISADAPPDACQRAGADLLSSCAWMNAAVLVLGDGSACRSVKAPGYLDPRAAGFDAEVEDALRAGDPAALSDVSPQLAAGLLAAGRAAWHAAAAAALAAGTGWTCTSFHAEDPYGVWYPVALWQAETSAQLTRT